MALAFNNASSNRVDAGDGATIQNQSALTVLAWAYTTTTGTAQAIMFKNASGKIFNLTAGGLFQGFVGRSTLDALVTASNANCPNFGTNKWFCVAYVLDTGATNADQRVFTGDLTHDLAEATSYTTQRVGSGTVKTDAGTNMILGCNNAFAQGWQGRIARVKIFRGALTLAQCVEEQWSAPPVNPGSCIGYWELGFNGTGTQPDWSGNGNAGTVTGATVADHVPLGPPFGFDAALPYAVAAAGGTPVGADAWYHYREHVMRGAA